MSGRRRCLQAPQLLQLALAAALASCSVEPRALDFGAAPDGPGAIGRFIVGPAPLLAEPDALYRWQAVGAWDLGDPEDAGWDIHPRERVREAPAGMRIRRGRGRVVFSRAIGVEAAEVDRIELQLHHFSAGTIVLVWRGQDGEQQRWERTLGGGEARYSFDVVRHAGWRGTIERLTVQLEAEPSAAPIFQSLVLQRRASFAEDFSPERPLAVELAHDVRSALLQPVGANEELDPTFERRLEVRPGDRFRAAVGLESSARGMVRFSVSAAVGGAADTLIERTVGAGAAANDRWHPLELDLSAYAGQSITLRLAAEPSGGGAAPLGLALWANPEVVRQTSGPERRSVLLISIDTLRADHLSAYGYGLDTTPRLDAWARRRATLFTRTVAASPFTLPAHVSLLSGLDAAHHGFNHDVGRETNAAAATDRSAPELLAETLRRAGYSTAAFTGGAYMHPRFGFGRGFDRYEYWPHLHEGETELETGIARARDWLRERRGEPTLFLLHTYEVHDPYRARQPWFDRFAAPGVRDPGGTVAIELSNPEALGFRQTNELVLRSADGSTRRTLGEADAPLVQALYDSGIGYMDERIGGLLGELDALPEAERPIVVLTSDHGEALGEGGLRGHLSLYDHTLLIPLLVAVPGGPGAGRRVDAQVRTVDVAPTILELLGLRPGEAVDGRSLVPLLEGRAAPPPEEAWSYAGSMNRGVALRRGDREKFILDNTPWLAPSERREWYDLMSDPRERTNLAQAQQASPLEARAVEYLRGAAGAIGLRIANASEGVLQGTIRGPLVSPMGTKSPDTTGAWLRWSGPGEIALELPPGQSFTLIFEKLFGSRLELEGELAIAGESIAYDATLELAALREGEGAATLGYQPAGWSTTVEPEPDVATGFAAWWRGAATLHSASPAAQDPELESALRALGYVE
jgi:arylsulfatase A-like enzyme